MMARGESASSYVILFAILLAAGFTAGAQAGDSNAARACRKGEAGSRVAGCSALLAEAHTARQRAIAFDGRCWANNDRQEHAAALPDCKNAIAADPTYPYSHHNLGSALAGMGDHRGAVAAFSKAIDLRPAVAYQYVSRAKSLQQIGDRTGAIQDFEMTLRLQPGNVDARVGLANSSTAAREPASLLPVPSRSGGANFLCGLAGCQ